MISNVTNIQNITPTSYFENIQNIYQTTHNFHQNSLNFIANTAVKMVNIFGPQTTGPGERGDGVPLLISSMVGRHHHHRVLGRLASLCRMDPTHRRLLTCSRTLRVSQSLWMGIPRLRWPFGTLTDV